MRSSKSYLFGNPVGEKETGQKQHLKNYRLRVVSVLCYLQYAAAAAKSIQSCPTLCDPTDGSPPGSSVPGTLQAILERVAVSFPDACSMLSRFSHVQLCATLWTAALQAPLSMGFSRQEYWSGVPLPSPKAKMNNPSPLIILRE